MQLESRVSMNAFVKQFFIYVGMVCILSTCLMACSKNLSPPSFGEFVLDFPTQPIEVSRGEPTSITVNVVDQGQDLGIPKIEYFLINSIVDEKDSNALTRDRKIRFLTENGSILGKTLKIDFTVDYDHDLNATEFAIQGRATSDKAFKYFEQKIRLKIIPSQKTGSLDEGFGIDGFFKLQYGNPWSFEKALPGINNNFYLMFSYISTPSAYHKKIIKLDVDGKLDKQFANNGELILDFNELEHVFIERLRNGFLLIATCSFPSCKLKEIDTFGKPNLTFGKNGEVIKFRESSIIGGIDFFSDITGVSKDEFTGGFFVFGERRDSGERKGLVVAHYNQDGQLDGSFFDSGILSVPQQIEKVSGFIDSHGTYFYTADKKVDPTITNECRYEIGYVNANPLKFQRVDCGNTVYGDRFLNAVNGSSLKLIFENSFGFLNFNSGEKCFLSKELKLFNSYYVDKTFLDKSDIVYFVELINVNVPPNPYKVFRIRGCNFTQDPLVYVNIGNRGVIAQSDGKILLIHDEAGEVKIGRLRP
jgi:hypothetical protein